MMTPRGARLVIGVALASGLLAAESTGDAAAACLRAGGFATVEGRLGGLQLMSYAGQNRYTYRLDLAAPACLEGTAPEERLASAQSIYVFATDARLQNRIEELSGRYAAMRLRGEVLAADLRHKAVIVVRVEELALP